MLSKTNSPLMQKLFKCILLLCKMKSFVKQTVRHEDLLTMLTFVMSCEKEKKDYYLHKEIT